MRRANIAFVVFALVATGWSAAAAEVISLVSQERTVSAHAAVAPTNPPGPEQTQDQTQQASDFGLFDDAATAAMGMGDTALGSASAAQTSSIVGALVHANGHASAAGACLPSVACGTGSATSSFVIRFSVPVSSRVHIVGNVATQSGAPRLRFAISGPGVTLVSDGNGGAEDIDLDALLTPGEYTLEALVQAASGDAGSFQFDATFAAELVGVEAVRWGDVKQRFR